MAGHSEGDSRSTQELLHLLCCKVTGLKDDEVTPYYKIALATVSSSVSTPSENDEFAIAKKIKKKLEAQQRVKDAAYFSELHRKLQRQDVLHSRWAVLYLLTRLSGDGANRHKAQSPFYSGFKDLPTSTPFQRGVHGAGGRGEEMTPRGDRTALALGVSGAGSSGIGSTGLSSIRPGETPSTRGPTPTPSATAASNATLPQSYWQSMGANTGQRLQSGLSNPPRSMPPPQHAPAPHSRPRSRVHGGQTENTSFEVPEWSLVRDIIFVLQGIEGKYIKSDNNDGYIIDPKAGIPRSVRVRLARLAECGWLCGRVRRYADARSTDRAFGLVGQSLCAALHRQLAEYYRLLAVLHAQQQQEEEEGVDDEGSGGGRLTLRRLSVWSADPILRLKILAALVDVCQGKKGGALASAIHSYLQHGAPAVRGLVRHMLAQVARPVFALVTRWIYDGELDDTYHEFFVASDPIVKAERLWHDKYSLRRAMVPSFLPTHQAHKIVLTGKSINFLRQLCHDRTTIRTRDVVKNAHTSRVESMFEQDMDGAFGRMINTVYQETSRHLLEVLHTKYKFLEHLKAMRRYLLLGQGDFIRHLMDLLEEDLAKPASQLFMHNLTGIQESAVRATNAQYDDQDILDRLDVRLLEVSPGDAGWDVFSLDYHVDGPIKTVFTPECMVMYLRVFNFLWRAKRMEYTLAGIWKGQMANARVLRGMPEMGAVLHQMHVIGSEMVHFVQQVQYYINFEVLECSWDELLKRVAEAEDLDHIIAAHQVFLDNIMTRSLLDTGSSTILTQLRTIFDLIIQFQGITDATYTATAEESAARQRFQDMKALQEKQGKWSVTSEEEQQERRRRDDFCTSVIPGTRAKLRVLAQSYQNMVQQFLVMLNGHQDASLRFLSFRLDFNEHYRAKDSRLRTPQALHKSKRRT